MNKVKVASELLKLAKSLVSTSQSAEDFVDYLKTTLIPDLKESGMVETANDFKKAIRLIESGRKDASFISFLKNRLIPDLKESGMEYTAEDFEEAIHWMTSK